jgi:iron(III) transport system substrate-binding protein
MPAGCGIFRQRKVELTFNESLEPHQNRAREEQMALAKSCKHIAPLLVLLSALLLPAALRAASVPATPADLALYKGPDREKILIEGAKKEGQLTVYTSNSVVAGLVSQAFEKKFPFIRVTSWQAESATMLKRVTEENRTGRAFADVVESSPELMGVLHRENMLQEQYSPELAAYPDTSKIRGKSGVVYWANREIYFSLGFNTKWVPVNEAPRVLKDLLEPRFKGNIGISGHSTGARWVGAVLDLAGMEFLERLSRQGVRVFNVAGPAMRALVAAGEIPVTPTLSDSNAIRAKQQGAPVEWRPMEPVMANVGYSGMFRKLPHPHGAVLFLDYLHSKEGQQLAMKAGGVSSPRRDLVSPETNFKKTYLEAKYSLDELENKLGEWDQLLRKLFLRKQ